MRGSFSDDIDSIFFYFVKKKLVIITVLANQINMSTKQFFQIIF